MLEEFGIERKEDGNHNTEVSSQMIIITLIFIRMINFNNVVSTRHCILSEYVKSNFKFRLEKFLNNNKQKLTRTTIIDCRCATVHSCELCAS